MLGSSVIRSMNSGCLAGPRDLDRGLEVIVDDAGEPSGILGARSGAMAF
jgi:hypothetical protein